MTLGCDNRRESTEWDLSWFLRVFFVGLLFPLVLVLLLFVVFFFFNDTATTEIYTLSLHDALPIWP